MAPLTPIGISPISQSISVASRQQSTVHVVITSTQNVPGGSSSTQKLMTPGISSNTPGVTDREKSSTVGLSSTRISTINSRSTTPKPASVTLSTVRSNPPSVPSTSIASLSTTRRNPFISVQSPGGNHPNYSTILPPISQGQHGTANGDGDGANTSTIIAGVLVPLILIGVAALAVYIWYRRKYPVRMVLGRDFNRFSNPAYSKRASTLTLVRNDERKEWDTLCRRNPDLSKVIEDEQGGIENEAFDSENEEGKGKDNDIRPEADIENPPSNDMDKTFEEDGLQNEGIRRERPKTKKAILVKTSTMEDFENGFELVTESDLGQRTESEVSSGNDSTETHTISLTFSETFDERHKTERSVSDIGDVKDSGAVCVENIDLDNKENISLKSASEDTIGEGIDVRDDNTLDVSEIGSSQGNQSFEILGNEQENDAFAVQDEPDVAEGMTDTSQMLTDFHSQENSEEVLQLETQDIDSGGESCIPETVNFTSPLDKVGIVSEIVINDMEQQENIQENLNASHTTGEDESEDGFQDNKVQAEDETYQQPSHNTSYDKQEVINEDKSKDDDISQNNMTNEYDRNVLEKEKTEVLEKEKNVVGSNDLQVHSLIDSEGALSEGSADELDSQCLIAQRIKPSLQLSNENIVLDSVPQSPIVLVQESFILENESPLPVYLDSTHMSPGRGRRAFTLNDIASKGTSNGNITSEFSLPNLNDEISKSSPVISELKTFTHKQFEFESKHEESRSTDDQVTKKGLTSESIKSETFQTCADEEEGQKQVSSFNDVPETSEINENEDNQLVASIFDSASTSGLENTHAKKDTCDESDEMFISLDSNSSEFTNNKSDNFKDLDSSNFDDFNFVNTGFQSGTEELSPKNSLNSQDDSLDANVITFDDKLTDDYPFVDNFPQSSTPTASFVAGESHDQDEDLIRKKLTPQTFDFGNFDESDSESSNSEKSSEKSEIIDTICSTPTGILVDTQFLGIEPFDKMDNARDNYEENVEKQTLASAGEMFSLTRSTDSSTELSWEILSGENSQDSKSNDLLDITTKDTKENTSEHQAISINKDQNNDLISLSTKPGLINFDSFDMSKQSSVNDTSMGSSTTTDISWEIVNEEGDNSEC